jgi:hypothetical protein
MSAAGANRLQTVLSGTGTSSATRVERRESSVPVSLPETAWAEAEEAG